MPRGVSTENKLQRILDKIMTQPDSPQNRDDMLRIIREIKELKRIQLEKNKLKRERIRENQNIERAKPKIAPINPGLQKKYEQSVASGVFTGTFEEWKASGYPS